MSKKVITFGEIMLRLATPDYLRFCQANQFNATFGGGEANVAASLANYAIETEFVTRLPKNDIARACVMELRKQGIGTSKIIYGGERLGIYFLETGAVARASKVVYDRAHSSIAEIRPGMIDWDEVFKDASWFHWTGITPAISEGAANVCLAAWTAPDATTPSAAIRTHTEGSIPNTGTKTGTGGTGNALTGDSGRALGWEFCWF